MRSYLGVRQQSLSHLNVYTRSFTKMPPKILITFKTYESSPRETIGTEVLKFGQIHLPFEHCQPCINVQLKFSISDTQSNKSWFCKMLWRSERQKKESLSKKNPYFKKWKIKSLCYHHRQSVGAPGEFLPISQDSSRERFFHWVPWNLELWIDRAWVHRKLERWMDRAVSCQKLER